jgi:sugar lactone lactonase YvrE
MNLEVDRRGALSFAAGLAALVVLIMEFGCGSDRVRPVTECVLRADPVMFGEVTVGDTLVEEATITNAGRNPLDLVATLDSPDFRLAAGDSVPVSLAVGDSVPLSVVYAPQTVGAKSAEIAFSDLACPVVEVSGGTPKAIPGFIGSISLSAIQYFSGAPIALAVGPSKNICVSVYDSYQPRGGFYDHWNVLLLTPDGSYMARRTDPLWRNPDGVAFAEDGSILMVDSGQGVVFRLSEAASVLGQIGLSRWAPGRFDGPSDVSMDEEGFVYVTDPYTFRVQKFTRAGEFVASWMDQYYAHYIMDFPWAVQADRYGSIIVGGLYLTYDHGAGHSVARISTEGALQWHCDGQWARGFATNGDGYIYLATTEGIVRLTSDGKTATQLSEPQIFNDVAADSSGHLYGVTADYLIKLTTTGSVMGSWPHGGGGVAFDETLGLFVLKGDIVTRLTPDGDVLGDWGGPGTADGLFNGASGIAVTPEGNVLVADHKNRRIQELTPYGAFVRKFGNVPDEPGWLDGPVDAAVGVEGTIYLVTTGDNRIQKFASDGTFLTRWGGLGQDPGRFDSPRGVAVGGSGDVYVWDTGNRRVQVFDADGGFLRAWEPIYALGTVEPWPATSSLGRSTGIAVTADDTVYLIDSAAHRVVAFSADGAPLGSWGGSGTAASQFSNPRDVAIGPDGRIYVLDSGGRSIQIFQLQSP